MLIDRCHPPVVLLIAFCAFIAVNHQGYSDSELRSNGNVSELISDKIPVAPKGFANSKGVMEALRSKKIPPINQSIEFPDVQVKRNVTYSLAAGERGVLDLYSPAIAKQPRIGLILVHGGGWRAGSKEDYRYYGQQFAHRGYVAACINYRLAPQTRFPTPVQDVMCAIRWMRANADELNVDPERIAIMGGSAGAHLALMAAYSAETKAFEKVGGYEDFESEVHAVVSIYGPTDLSSDFSKAEKMVPSLIQDFLGKSADQAQNNVALASPLTHLDPTDPTTLIIHGTIDSLVPIMQSDRLAAKLDEFGIPYVYDRIEGWPHAMDIAKPINDRVLFLVDNFLKNRFKTATLSQP